MTAPSGSALSLHLALATQFEDPEKGLGMVVVARAVMLALRVRVAPRGASK